MSVFTPLPIVPVAGSTNVKGVGYDPATYTMDVQYHAGGVYRYHGVPPPVHDGLLASRSKGEYVRTAIRGRFRHSHIVKG